MFDITERYELSSHSDGFSLIVNDSSSYGQAYNVMETAVKRGSVVISVTINGSTVATEKRIAITKENNTNTTLTLLSTTQIKKGNSRDT